MKVLFFNPSRSGQGNIPINIPLLIGIIKREGHGVGLFNLGDYAAFNDKSYEKIFFKYAPIDETLKISDYKEDFEEMVKKFKPDIIAVSCLSVDFKFTCRLLASLKNRHDIPVVFGGIHAILLPEETLNSGVCDFVCAGEGERSFPDLLKALENGLPLEKVRGIWFKKGGEIVKTGLPELTDLSTLPPSDFECFDPVHFRRPFDGKSYRMINYELSRGCPFNCSYCVNGVLKEIYKNLGPYHRIKSQSQSIKELKFLIGKHNFDFVRFWDEDFTSIPAPYLEKYSKLYLEEIGLPFLIYARVDTISEEKVRILKEMGCRTFAMGIESGNETIRKRVMNRLMSNEKIIEKFRLVKSYGIRVSAYNMMGLPYETRDNIFDTIELNRLINPDSFSVTLLEPYKGTPIRKMCEEEGLDPSYDITAAGRPQFIPRGFTESGLNGLFRTFALYVRFPKNRYDEIKKAETDDKVYRKIMEEFSGMK